MRFHVVLALVTTALPQLAHAQLVRGVVYVERDSARIETALLELIDEEGVVSDSAVSDTLGRFTLSSRSPGRYLLRASHLAFRSVARPIDLTLGYEVHVEMRMAPAAIALEPLVVTARREVPLNYVGFYRRSRSGAGRFLTRDDIERRQALRTTDLLRMMPRVSLTFLDARFAGRPAVTMRSPGGGLCTPDVFVDGMISLTAEDIDMLLPEDIDGVEVYTSSAMTPMEFRRGTNCGAILFWLRKDVEGRVFTWKRLLIGVGAFLGLVLIAGR